VSSKPKNKAVYRVVYRSKDGEKQGKCATLWSTQFPNQLSFAPVTEPDEEYNEVAFTEALTGYLNKEGWLNVYLVEPKGATKGGKKRQQEEDADDDFA
jgi:hypothetical protein